MAYLTRTDLELAYGQALLAQVATDRAGGVDDLRIARAVSSAQATVDRMLRGRYAVPFSTVPVELLDVVQALAWHQLWLTASEIPEGVEAGRKGAVAALQALANGTAELGPEVPRASSSAPAVGRSGVFAAPREMRYDEAWERQFLL